MFWGWKQTGWSGSLQGFRGQQEKRVTEMTGPHSQHKQNVAGMELPSRGRQVPPASSLIRLCVRSISKGPTEIPGMGQVLFQFPEQTKLPALGGLPF